MSRYSFHLIITTLFVFALGANADSLVEMQECSNLKEITGINTDNLVKDGESPDEPSYGFREDGIYFCGADAPTYLRCKCGISSVCSVKKDPWGLDMGECGCCTTWVIILFSIFLVVIVVVLIGGLYACVCHGTWIYDGYPQAITPLLPQRSATIIAPATFPLPEQAFRPYRSSDFVSSDDPQVIEAAIASAAAQQDNAGNSEEGGGLRRRRGRGGDVVDSLAVPMNTIQPSSRRNQTAATLVRRQEERNALPPSAPPATIRVPSATSNGPASGGRLPQADSFGDLNDDDQPPQQQQQQNQQPNQAGPGYSPANAEADPSATTRQASQPQDQVEIDPTL